MADRSAELSDAQLARIRLVTRRYHELQGLSRCALGAGFIAGGLIVPQALDLQGSFGGFLLAAAIAAGIAVPAAWASRTLYERRFGRVRHGDDVPAGARRGLLFGLAVGAVIIADEDFFGPGYPSLLFLCVAAPPAWMAVRDWPLRKYLILETAAAVLVSALYMAVEPAGSRDANAALYVQYWITGWGLLGVPMIITGMLDHRLLMRTLHCLPEPHERCEHADAV